MSARGRPAVPAPSARRAPEPAQAHRHRPPAWPSLLCLALLGAAALTQIGRLTDMARWVSGTTPVCSGPAAPPAWSPDVRAGTVGFLTSEPDPLRSEQFFCLQSELLPSVLVRPPLAEPDRPVGFGPGRPAVIFATDESTRAALLERLRSEASGVAPAIRAESDGWIWVEVGTR